MINSNLILAILWTITAILMFANVVVRSKNGLPSAGWSFCLGLDICCAVIYYVRYFSM